MHGGAGRNCLCVPMATAKLPGQLLGDNHPQVIVRGAVPRDVGSLRYAKLQHGDLRAFGDAALGTSAARYGHQRQRTDHEKEGLHLREPPLAQLTLRPPRPRDNSAISHRRQ